MDLRFYVRLLPFEPGFSFCRKESSESLLEDDESYIIGSNSLLLTEFFSTVTLDGALVVFSKI